MQNGSDMQLIPVYVCGEALIDFVPHVVSDQVPGFVPKPGGSPYNVAIAAARAGASARFVGKISRDLFGDMLERHLVENGVDGTDVSRSNRPSTLAFVDMGEESPRYSFHNIGTANVHMHPAISDPGDHPAGILHVGSISLITPPASDRIEQLVMDSVNTMSVSIDPNVRSGMITDRAEWLGRINRLMGISTIIKMSLEDLEFIDPEACVDDYAGHLLNAGAALVLMTRGSGGATAYTGNCRASCQVASVSMVDTVGAGDTLMGAALAWLAENGIAEHQRVKSMTRSQIEQMLAFAVTAAGLNCECEGCDPPTLAMIKERLSMTDGSIDT